MSAILAVVSVSISLGWADPPPQYLWGAEIHLSSPIAYVGAGRKRAEFALEGRTLKGYIVIDPFEVSGSSFNVTSPETREAINRLGLHFIPGETVFLIKLPKRALVTTLGHHYVDIPVKNLVSIKKWAGPYDGTHAYAQPIPMPSSQVLILLHDRLVHSCAARYGFAHDTVWVSFDPSVGKEQLAAVCEGDFRRSAPSEAIDQLRAHPKVFTVSIPSD